MILRLQHLTELIEAYEKKTDTDNERKVHTCLELIEKDLIEGEVDYSEENIANYRQIRSRFLETDVETRVKDKQFFNILLTLRGLLFDMKTRLEYESPLIAIQDKINIKDYSIEVLTDIRTELEGQSLLDGAKVREIKEALSSLLSTVQEKELIDAFTQGHQFLRELEKNYQEQR